MTDDPRRELDEILRDRELNAWSAKRFCHWKDCIVADPDLLEEDHIYEFVHYAKLLDAIHYFQTDFPYPYKLVKSWIICSAHHSKATQMRIRGEKIEYPERLQELVDKVLQAGQALVRDTQWELEKFRIPEVRMRTS